MKSNCSKMKIYIQNSTCRLQQARWLKMMECFLVLDFVLALRGNEGFMVETGGLNQHIIHGTEPNEAIPFVVIQLLGRFQNEKSECWHLMLAASVTVSGLDCRTWTEWVANMRLVICQGK